MWNIKFDKSKKIMNKVLLGPKHRCLIFGVGFHTKQAIADQHMILSHYIVICLQYVQQMAEDLNKIHLYLKQVHLSGLNSL